MADFVDPESGLKYKPKPKPAKPYRVTEYDFESGLGGGRGRSALPNMTRYMDIPAADYPAGIPTGVGGGNAGPAQSQDPKASAYIPPTVTPTTPTPSPAPAPAPSPAPTARGDKNDPAPDGSGARGTYTGYRTPELSEVPGMADINNFFSAQLPESSNEATYSLDANILKAQGGGYLDGFQGGTSEDAIEYATSKGYTPGAVFEGISTPGKNGSTPTETADNTRAITIEPNQGNANWVEGFGPGVGNDGPDPSSYATSYDARRTAQRNAFLSDDYDTSLDAIRASNQAIGVDQLGHKFYANDGGTLVEISKEAYDKQRSTGLSAQEFKDARVGKIKETLVPAETPDVTDTKGDSTPDSGKNEGGNDFSAVDYSAMGGSTKDAAQIAGGGAVETTITPEGMKSNYFTKDQEWEFGINNSNPGT